MLEGFTVYGNYVSTVFSTLLKQPFYCFKVVTVFNAEDPLYLLILALILTILFVYYRQQTTENLSAMDQLWSILPAVYITLFNVHYYRLHRGAIHERLVLLWFLIMAWSVRLTFNLYIKGGYTAGHEDYRWRQLRVSFFGKPLKWFAVRTVATVYLPLSNWLQIVLPAYVVYRGEKSLQPIDFALALIHLFFLAIETVADYQMYTFQQLKKVRLRSRDYTGDAFTHGYMQEGLYNYSRHPNYFGEAGQWLTIFLFTCVHAGINWSILGFLNFSVLLYNSLYLTEFYTTHKYPKWKYYAGQLNPIFLRPRDPNGKPIHTEVVPAKEM